ncbi:TSUP family transporter [Roseateles saccharophilus]|uniref:Probable membrane transporter protein n=1 Tax=Roseateles saccharophilus TaxID=304 RepID=A0A4R3UR84_ROSSA|nr:TSUP family transporter [Roseateles saccharophilus]MDG0833489.1 sulfite exporter TauE/SafE family protein [Roseateles saccharophilus]TCU92514.1 sulfite exporter TauE/SafE [Roseateles saccharophilus]
MNYFLFAICVGFATYLQGLTGFAFALVLLTLSSLLQLASVGDAANAATVLGLLNAIVYLRAHPLTPQWRVVLPALPGGLVGVGFGVLLLGWLSSNAVQLLGLMLGATIIACAALLLVQQRTRASMSMPLSYGVAGALSGLLGGLFSAAGPPLVFHMYRQPLPQEAIRQCLFVAVAVNSLVRLILVLAVGRFSREALLLSLCAVPIVYGVSRVQRRFPLRVGSIQIRRFVALLLMLAGAVLLVHGAR